MIPRRLIPAALAASFLLLIGTTLPTYAAPVQTVAGSHWSLSPADTFAGSHWSIYPDTVAGSHWSVYPVDTVDTLAPDERFADGFAALSLLVDTTMGTPTEAPHVLESGDTVQLTTTGLAYYDPSENTPAFFQPSTGERYAITAEVGLVKWVGPELMPPAWVIDAYRPQPAVIGLAAAGLTTPYDYLYATYPRLAPALDRIARCESGWAPLAKNAHSTASGLFQFLSSTWATTPQGLAGYSPFDPFAAVDAGAWLYSRSGAWPWLSSRGCHHLL